MTKTATNTLADLSPISILALSKMLSEKIVNDARDQVDAGEHDIEVVLHLRGEVVVDEDSEALQVNRLQPLLLLKLAMDKLNSVSLESLVGEAAEILAKRNEIRHAKQKAAERAAQGKKVEDVEIEEPADELEFKERVGAAYKKLARKTAQRKRGSVVFDGELACKETG